MPYDECACTSAEGGAKENAHVEAGDAVLRADGDDVRARHVVMTVDEECGKVLAVGEADECMQRVGAGGRVTEGRLCQTQRPSGLHEANFINRDFVDGGFCRIHGDLPCEGAALVGSFVQARTARRSLPWRSAFPEGFRERDTGKAELRHPKGRR